MSEPIINIVSNAGQIYPAGVKYARGYDGANAEAVEVYGLKKGEFKLITVGWTKTSSQLSGCSFHSFYVD